MFYEKSAPSPFIKKKVGEAKIIVFVFTFLNCFALLCGQVMIANGSLNR
jgi:hypothetical protein